MNIRILGLLAALVALSFGIAHADSGYVRFCTIYAPRPNGASPIDSRQQRDLDEISALLATDGRLADLAQAQLGLARTPVVVARGIQRIYGKPHDREIVLLSDLDSTTPHWWKATLRADSSIAQIGPADAHMLGQTVGFSREMAAYVVLNDLLGGDAVFPRAGCAAVFDLWFGWAPPVNDVLKASVATDPVQDPALAARIRTAWNAFVPSSKSPGYRLTRETMARVGKNPPVAIVYLDVGLPGDGIGKIDVVRIGGAIHTYAMVVPAQPITFDSPMCVTGDERCGEYYSWP